MTTIVTLFALTAIAFWLYAEYQRNRCENLEIMNCDLRDQLAEAHAALDAVTCGRAPNSELLRRLDDATRERDRLAVSNAALIREATTMSIDLACVENQLQCVRSYRRNVSAMRAGVVLLAGAAKQEAKMHAWSELP